MFTYRVAPEQLIDFMPPGLIPDSRESGEAFVSLVAFDFLDTRVLGVKWPGFVNFPEINLRFYVRHGHDRGVAFVREFVPSKFVAWMARTLYNEPYLAAPMSSRVDTADDTIVVKHELDYGGRKHGITLRALNKPHLPESDGLEHFFKEHKWGYGKQRNGTLLRYAVEHPLWRVFPVLGWDLQWDWEQIYGRQWACLYEREPVSVLLAEGSAIGVYPHGIPSHGRPPDQ